LTAEELEAVKRGDQHEMLHIGLDPDIFEPAPAKRPRLASIVSSKPGRMVAAALIALTLAAMPMATHAAGPHRTTPGRQTAGARLSEIRFRGPSGLRTSLRRTSSARVRAVRARVRAQSLRQRTQPSPQQRWVRQVLPWRHGQIGAFESHRADNDGKLRPRECAS